MAYDKEQIFVKIISIIENVQVTNIDEHAKINAIFKEDLLRIS